MSRPRLARDTLLSLAAIVLVGASGVVYNVALGRALGQRALGHAALALAVALGLAQVATAGLAPAVTRFTAARRAAGRPADARRTVVLTVVATLTIGLVLAGLLRVGSASWAPLLGLPAALVAPVAALVLLRALYITLKAALYGLGRAVTYARLEVLAAMAFMAVLAVVLSGGAGGLLAPWLAGSAVFALGAAAATWRALRAPAQDAGPTVENDGTDDAANRPDGPPAPDQPLGRYVAIATVGSAAAIARLHLVVLVTGALRDAAAAGRLQAAMSFVPGVLLLPRALELALLPSLADAFGRADRPRFRRQAAAGLTVNALAVALVAGGMVTAAPWLLEALYGTDFAAARPALVVVLVGAWALGVATPAVIALSGADGVSVPNAAGVLALAVSLVAWAAWVPDSGALGAAAGFALGSLVIAVVVLLATRRRYGVTLGPALEVTLTAGGLLAVAWLLTRGLALPALPTAVGYGALLGGAAYRRRTALGLPTVGAPQSLVTWLRR